MNIHTEVGTLCSVLTIPVSGSSWGGRTPVVSVSFSTVTGNWNGLSRLRTSQMRTASHFTTHSGGGGERLEYITPTVKTADKRFPQLTVCSPPASLLTRRQFQCRNGLLDSAPSAGSHLTNQLPYRRAGAGAGAGHRGADIDQIVHLTFVHGITVWCGHWPRHARLSHQWPGLRPAGYWRWARWARPRPARPSVQLQWSYYGIAHIPPPSSQRQTPAPALLNCHKT